MHDPVFIASIVSKLIKNDKMISLFDVHTYTALELVNPKFGALKRSRTATDRFCGFLRVGRFPPSTSSRVHHSNAKSTSV